MKSREKTILAGGLSCARTGADGPAAEAAIMHDIAPRTSFVSRCIAVLLPVPSVAAYRIVHPAIGVLERSTDFRKSICLRECAAVQTIRGRRIVKRNWSCNAGYQARRRASPDLTRARPSAAPLRHRRLSADAERTVDIGSVARALRGRLEPYPRGADAARSRRSRLLRAKQRISCGAGLARHAQRPDALAYRDRDGGAALVGRARIRGLGSRARRRLSPPVAAAEIERQAVRQHQQRMVL